MKYVGYCLAMCSIYVAPRVSSDVGNLVATIWLGGAVAALTVYILNGWKK